MAPPVNPYLHYYRLVLSVSNLHNLIIVTVIITFLLLSFVPTNIFNSDKSAPIIITHVTAATCPQVNNTCTAIISPQVESTMLAMEEEIALLRDTITRLRQNLSNFAIEQNALQKKLLSESNIFAAPACPSSSDINDYTRDSVQNLKILDERIDTIRTTQSLLSQDLLDHQTRVQEILREQQMKDEHRNSQTQEIKRFLSEVVDSFKQVDDKVEEIYQNNLIYERKILPALNGASGKVSTVLKSLQECRIATQNAERRVQQALLIAQAAGATKETKVTISCDMEDVKQTANEVAKKEVAMLKADFDKKRSEYEKKIVELEQAVAFEKNEAANVRQSCSLKSNPKEQEKPPRDDFDMDFALLSAGAEVVANLTSPTYIPGKHLLDAGVMSLVELTGLTSVHDLYKSVSNSVDLPNALGYVVDLGTPEDALNPILVPGSCWPMLGSAGNLTVQIARSVLVKGISIDHLSRSEAGKTWESAPRRFSLYGAENIHGSWRYVPWSYYKYA